MAGIKTNESVSSVFGSVNLFANNATKPQVKSIFDNSEKSSIFNNKNNSSIFSSQPGANLFQNKAQTMTPSSSLKVSKDEGDEEGDSAEL